MHLHVLQTAEQATTSLRDGQEPSAISTLIITLLSISGGKFAQQFLWWEETSMDPSTGNASESPLLLVSFFKEPSSSSLEQTQNFKWNIFAMSRGKNLLIGMGRLSHFPLSWIGCNALNLTLTLTLTLALILILTSNLPISLTLNFYINPTSLCLFNVKTLTLDTSWAEIKRWIYLIFSAHTLIMEGRNDAQHHSW